MKNKATGQRLGALDKEGKTTKGITAGKKGENALRSRRYAPGMTEALMIPAGFVAIN